MYFLLMNVQTSVASGRSSVPGALEHGYMASLQKSVLAETFLQAGPTVRLVLLFLIMLSVICWGIIFYKALVLRNAHRNSDEFLELFSNASSMVEVYHASKNIPPNPLLEVFESGYRELSRLLVPSQGSPGSRAGPEQTSPTLKIGGVENVNRAMRKVKTRVSTRMEKYLTFLATTGATAPFIGLFGTVWGIMNAFRSIGATGSANLATVAPGIAEALIATAVGLFAAIPAVVAYNFFVQRIRVLSKDMENFSTDLIILIERHLQKTA